MQFASNGLVWINKLLDSLATSFQVQLTQEAQKFPKGDIFPNSHRRSGEDHDALGRNGLSFLCV